MTKAYLEHANLTVQNPEVLASLFCRLFDWKIRWKGDAKDNGMTIHIGSNDSYLALYTHNNFRRNSPNHYVENSLNHLGVVVSDFEKVEASIKKEGFEPFNYGDYDPGRRFYFLIDNLEIEVINYVDVKDVV